MSHVTQRVKQLLLLHGQASPFVPAMRHIRPPPIKWFYWFFKENILLFDQQYAYVFPRPFF
jgi:hypothetical protein